MSRPPLWLMAALAISFAAGWYCRRQISDNNFLYAGADTYGYLKLADELWAHHRYALAPSPEPAHYARTPLYPLFIAAVKRERPATMTGGSGWFPIVNAQRWVELVLTGAFIYWLGTALRGRRAGVMAHLGIMLFPFTIVYFYAVFTETLAICLAAGTLALIASQSARRERVRHFAAGSAAALGTLLRPDGILLLPPLLLGVWLLPRDRRSRARLGAWLLAGFALTFSPWPLRNLVETGRAWPFGTRVDRYSHPVPNYSGYYDWLATWAVDQSVNPLAAWCFYDPSCGPQVAPYPSAAFDSPAEREEVVRLLALRRREQFSAGVSDGFAALARQRRRHHPVANLVTLPARRAYHVWINEHDDLLHMAQLPWPELFLRMRNRWTSVATWFCLAVIFSTGWLLWRRDTRRLAAVLGGAILVRTLFLAYFFYVEPRYTVEVMPLGLVLIAAALALASERLVRPRVTA